MKQPTNANVRESRVPDQISEVKPVSAPAPTTIAKPEPAIQPPSDTAKNTTKTFDNLDPAIARIVNPPSSNVTSLMETAKAYIDYSDPAITRAAQGYTGGNIPQTPTPLEKGTSADQLLVAYLVGAGVPMDLATSPDTLKFASSVYKDTKDYSIVATSFYNLKEYKTSTGEVISSPYYAQYGKYNDTLTKLGRTRKSSGDLISLVSGYKDLVAQYGVNSKFADPTSIEKYITNDVSVSELSQRMATAKMRATAVDPTYEKSLRDLGYITSTQDLTDFFLDPNIGKQALEQRQITVGVANEAARRGLNIANAKTLGAQLASEGYSESQAVDLANKAYTEISNTLPRESFLAGVYKDQSASASQIQTELEQEQFLGQTSQRRKRINELETNMFSGSSGMYQPYRYGARQGALGTGTGEGQL